MGLSALYDLSVRPDFNILQQSHGLFAIAKLLVLTSFAVHFLSRYSCVLDSQFSSLLQSCHTGTVHEFVDLDVTWHGIEYEARCYPWVFQNEFCATFFYFCLCCQLWKYWWYLSAFSVIFWHICQNMKIVVAFKQLYRPGASEILSCWRTCCEVCCVDWIDWVVCECGLLCGKVIFVHILCRVSIKK